VEKRSPTYDLASIQAEFCTAAKLRATGSAMACARALGMDAAAVVAVIQAITRAHFYKSMTSHASARIWQDVYHVPCGAIVLYVKFTVDATGKLLISFKEK
jgi:motility quorum-sensing regulator/GCU-specific mRNA interferase toxin